jgi:hypothetical protein
MTNANRKHLANLEVEEKEAKKVKHIASSNVHELTLWDTQRKYVLSV